VINSIIFDSFDSFAALKKILAQQHNVIIERLWPSAKAFWIWAAHQLGYSVLCICADTDQQSKLLAELGFFFKKEQLIDFPSWESLPCEPSLPSIDVVGLRMKGLWQLSSNHTRAIVIANVQSFQQRTPSLSSLKNHVVELRIGLKLSMKQCQSSLEKLGYSLVDRVTDKGQYALRQDIIDIFPPQELEPIRVEWWGDEIETLRSFDSSSQCSLETKDLIFLLPSCERRLMQEDFGQLIDFMPSNYCLVLDEIQEIEDRYVEIDALPGSIHSYYWRFEKALEQVKAPKLFFSSSSIDQLSDVKQKMQNNQLQLEFEIFSQRYQADSLHSLILRLHERFLTAEIDSSIPPFFQSLKQAAEDDFHIIILFASEAEKHQAQVYLKSFDRQDSYELQPGYLSSSLVFETLKIIIAPIAEYTKHPRLWRSKLRVSHTPVSYDLLDLELGCNVVHLHHGIGVYRGIEKQKNHAGVEKDFLKIEYANQSKIFVPLEQAHLLSRYQAFDDRLIELHQIGTTKWKKQWQTAQDSIQGYAKQLLELYASRQIYQSMACPVQDSLSVVEFETDFPYELTEDQIKAISAVKSDLCRPQPMDRLICGDVGYGKTEVAMRAAFKLVLDAKAQVALLAPTTVLALQHYETFSERMSGFGVQIAVLSRFTPLKDHKKILDDLKAGRIDIVIGTHRLLSKDVLFKNLGLMIIDEEQRFGVKAKEHLKLLKKEVNCLTLSATPIPRTLHLSLMGAKELSTIATPPHDRQPIATFVCAKEDQILRAALIRELGRGGQAFYVHNDTENLPTLANHLKKLVPQAKIGIVHGQMSAREIEEAFHHFKSHLIDILVTTTIIETGIDIANANTILIDHADRFGLADLYQLRGRVGRWNRKAYAYLLYTSKKALSTIAQKRLDAIQLSNGYGGGMKVALRDLEIRGCGELLGQQQSGHISSIGFSLYCRLLQRSLDQLQGKVVIEFEKIKLEHNFPIQIPEIYIDSITLRLEIYQRISMISDEGLIDTMKLEMRDRFGPLPIEAQWLFCLSVLRIYCAKAHIQVAQVHMHSSQMLQLTYEKNMGNGRFQKHHQKINCLVNPQNVQEQIKQIFLPLPTVKSSEHTSTLTSKMLKQIQNLKKLDR
jgi:transcription-repair coupling factor (superfamily II helicase)